MSISWYAVKTIFRSEARGKPRAADQDYDPAATLVEERVVLIRARSHAEAIQKAECEARKYAKDSYVNPYGQLVRTRYLGQCSSYELFEQPKSNKEVFSDTHVVSKSITDKKACSWFLGPKETKKKERLRKNFLNRNFTGNIKADS